MKVIKPSVKLITKLDQAKILKHIESIGRVCYKSESKITKDSAKDFVSMLIKRKHLSVLEHQNITFRII